MPHGIAIRRGPAPANFYAGSMIFQLYPSLGTFEGVDDHVVVAYSPAAVDHGCAETSVFKCEADGKVTRWQGLDHGAEALTPRERIVGRFDVEAALANLAGSGYLEVPEDDLPALRELAMAQAAAYGQAKLRMSAEEAKGYAGDNWGIFAAMHLVASGRRDQPVRTLNHYFAAPLAPLTLEH